jgi:hypothetical protein
MPWERTPAAAAAAAATGTYNLLYIKTASQRHFGGWPTQVAYLHFQSGQNGVFCSTAEWVPPPQQQAYIILKLMRRQHTGNTLATQHREGGLPSSLGYLTCTCGRGWPPAISTTCCILLLLLLLLLLFRLPAQWPHFLLLLLLLLAAAAYASPPVHQFGGDGVYGRWLRQRHTYETAAHWQDSKQYHILLLNSFFSDFLTYSFLSDIGTNE